MASGFPDNVPAWYTGPDGATSAIRSARPRVRPDRQASADDLPQTRQVRAHAPQALGAPRRDSKAGNDFVEDQQQAVPIAELPQGLQETRRG